MHADAWSVLALMAGFATMVGVGAWAHLDEETQADIARTKGRLLAGAGAAAGVLVLLAAA